MFKLILVTGGCDISSEIALRWTSLHLSGDKSTLVLGHNELTLWGLDKYGTYMSIVVFFYQQNFCIWVLIAMFLF